MGKREKLLFDCKKKSPDIQRISHYSPGVRALMKSADFSLAANIEPTSVKQSWTMTNRGLSITLPILAVPWDHSQYLAILNCGESSRVRGLEPSVDHRMSGHIAVPLRAMVQEHSVFIRRPGTIESVQDLRAARALNKAIHIANDPLVLSGLSRYLDVYIHCDRLPELQIRGLASFEFDPVSGVRSDLSEFKKDRRNTICARRRDLAMCSAM